MNNLFTKDRARVSRGLVLVFLLILIVLLDTYTGLLKPAKNWLGNWFAPVYWVTDIPSRVGEWFDDSLVDRDTLQLSLQEAETELRIHKGRLQRMADLAAENVRLRQLLNATELLQDSVLVSELIGVSPDPASQTIILNRGERDGVYVGQAVLDAYGLMGQVTEVYDDHSRALLITDTSHALPVQVLRNGVRSIAEGIGDYARLRLRFVSPTTDIRVGDQLVSSGLGGRYPVGYPVGEVVDVALREGSSYMDVSVEPTAWLDRSRHLLLVFHKIDRLEE
ncbi:MAG: rod shape-determining protein MreC [bacterium]